MESGLEGLENRVSCEVHEVLFLGHERELLVDAMGQRLTVRISGDGRASVGDMIEIGWPSSACVIVEDTGT